MQPHLSLICTIGRWQAFQKLWFPFSRLVCRFWIGRILSALLTRPTFFRGYHSPLQTFLVTFCSGKSNTERCIPHMLFSACSTADLPGKRVRSFIERHLLESKDSLYPSFYALSTAVVLLVNFSCWAPVNGTVWSLQSSWLVYATLAVNVTSWCLVFASLLSIHWFELCGGRASSGLLFRKDVVSNAPRCN